MKALGLQFQDLKNEIRINSPAGQIILRNGKAEYQNARCQETVNSIKKAYSQQTISAIAKKYKFTLTTKADQSIVIRRY